MARGNQMQISISHDELRKLRNQLSDHQAIRDLILEHMATLNDDSLTGTEMWIKGMLTDLVTGETEGWSVNHRIIYGKSMTP